MTYEMFEKMEALRIALNENGGAVQLFDGTWISDYGCKYTLFETDDPQEVGTEISGEEAAELYAMSIAEANKFARRYA